MNLEFSHTTLYRYPKPAWDSHNHTWLHPQNTVHQRVTSHSISLEQNTPLVAHKDYYNNQTSYFHLMAPHQELLIVSRGVVITEAAEALPESLVEEAQNCLGAETEFIYPSPRVALDRSWLAATGMPSAQPEQPLAEYLLILLNHFHKRFVYEPGSTHVHTPLSEFVTSKAGVCQDYSHAAIAILREQKIPARYVSGYLHTGLGSRGSHAWIEVFFPDAGWVGFDPTNQTPVGEGYIKLAHGRDYDDCPPLRGVRRGGGKEEMLVEVSVHLSENMALE